MIQEAKGEGEAQEGHCAYHYCQIYSHTRVHFQETSKTIYFYLKQNNADVNTFWGVTSGDRGNTVRHNFCFQQKRNNCLLVTIQGLALRKRQGRIKPGNICKSFS